MYRKFGKRAFDFHVALILLIVCFPLILAAFLVLAISNRGNPFFSQMRPGLHGRVFRIYKFKTMSDRLDAKGDLLPDELRISWLGSMIRMASIDELPQLWNVILGDMSMIGPRPLLVEYLPLYDDKQARRHLVRPGITGWAQVNGRNAITWEQKFDFDVWYVDNLSFSIDLKILLKTLYKVLKPNGVNAAGGNFMPKFTGK